MLETNKINKPAPIRRTHKKSRTGCRNCKLRRIKCDETKPSCRRCLTHKTRCDYLDEVTSSEGNDSHAAESMNAAVVAGESKLESEMESRLENDQDSEQKSGSDHDQHLSHNIYDHPLTPSDTPFLHQSGFPASSFHDEPSPPLSTSRPLVEPVPPPLLLESSTVPSLQQSSFFLAEQLLSTPAREARDLLQLYSSAAHMPSPCFSIALALSTLRNSTRASSLKASGSQIQGLGISTPSGELGYEKTALLQSDNCYANAIVIATSKLWFSVSWSYQTTKTVLLSFCEAYEDEFMLFHKKSSQLANDFSLLLKQFHSHQPLEGSSDFYSSDPFELENLLYSLTSGYLHLFISHWPSISTTTKNAISKEDIGEIESAWFWIVAFGSILSSFSPSLSLLLSWAVGKETTLVTSLIAEEEWRPACFYPCRLISFSGSSLSKLPGAIAWPSESCPVVPPLRNTYEDIVQEQPELIFYSPCDTENRSIRTSVSSDSLYASSIDYQLADSSAYVKRIDAGLSSSPAVTKVIGSPCEDESYSFLSITPNSDIVNTPMIHGEASYFCDVGKNSLFKADDLAEEFPMEETFYFEAPWTRA